MNYRYTQDEIGQLNAEIDRLKEQISHEWPAIEELTKEREMYRMRWLGSMTPEDAALIRAENERMKAAGRTLIAAIEDHTPHGWDKHSTGCAMCKAIRVGLLAFAHEQAATEKSCMHGTPESQVCGICCGYK